MISKKTRGLSDEERHIFLEELERIGNARNKYERVSKILHKYTARQLCHYYRNYLDPELYHGDLGDREKNFIDNWILINRTERGRIEWKNLRQDLQKECGFLRSENKVKNYWYSKQRNRSGTIPFHPLHPIHPFGPNVVPDFKPKEPILPFRI